MGPNRMHSNRRPSHGEPRQISFRAAHAPIGAGAPAGSVSCAMNLKSKKPLREVEAKQRPDQKEVNR